MHAFGTWLSRFLRGGVLLSSAEQWLLAEMLEALPVQLSDLARRQLASFNLAQREIDGRSINFYLPRRGVPDLQLLPTTEIECPLVRITVRHIASGEIVHATLNAVNGRVFCMSFSRAVAGLGDGGFEVLDTAESWRAFFLEGSPNNSLKRTDQSLRD
jgi:hypothetical protein